VEGNQSKLSPKSEKHISVGFEDGPMAVQYYDAKTTSEYHENLYFWKLTITEVERSRRLELEGENREDGNPQSQETPYTLDNPPTVARTLDKVQASITTRYQGREIQDIPLGRSARNISDYNYRKLANPSSRLPATSCETRPPPETPMTTKTTICRVLRSSL
jgi:hypothetical protein